MGLSGYKGMLSNEFLEQITEKITVFRILSIATKIVNELSGKILPNLCTKRRSSSGGKDLVLVTIMTNQCPK
jgi:hypothetical protein